MTDFEMVATICKMRDLAVFYQTLQRRSGKSKKLHKMWLMLNVNQIIYNTTKMPLLILRCPYLRLFYRLASTRCKHLVGLTVVLNLQNLFQILKLNHESKLNIQLNNKLKPKICKMSKQNND